MVVFGIVAGQKSLARFNLHLQYRAFPRKKSSGVEVGVDAGGGKLLLRVKISTLKWHI